MKKEFLFHLFAIAFFSLASLVIKSETLFCESICHCTPKNGLMNKIKILKSNTEEGYYKYDNAFFIKI